MNAHRMSRTQKRSHPDKDAKLFLFVTRLQPENLCTARHGHQRVPCLLHRRLHVMDAGEVHARLHASVARMLRTLLMYKVM